MEGLLFLVLLFASCAHALDGPEFYDPSVFYNTSRYEGDIIGFSPEKDGDLFYHATADKSVLWPNGQMIYHIDRSLQNYASLIKRSMDHISSRTGNCITFKQRTNEPGFVYIYSNQGCYSAVGRQGDVQELSLGEGCRVQGVIIHELLHALGFFHYHSRSDRDKYLKIMYQNIIPQMIPQFQRLSPWENKIFTDFDYNSIMIYGSTAFSRDGRSPTMVPLTAGASIRDPGYKMGLTDSDVTSIKKLYGCN